MSDDHNTAPTHLQALAVGQRVKYFNAHTNTWRYGVVHSIQPHTNRVYAQWMTIRGKPRSRRAVPLVWADGAVVQPDIPWEIA